jgi:cytochrome c-type biogenesis protein CcmF
MMNELGIISLLFSFAILLFSISQTLYGIWKQKAKSIELGRLSLFANAGVVCIAFIILMTQLYRMDLTNHYVVMHSSDSLNLFYRITSIWSGSSGSLLFWNLLLSFFTVIVLYQTKNRVNDRLPIMHLSLASISILFSFLAVFYSDAQPFRQFDPPAAVGRGLNPLLQHWAMIIHPPILYIGYVSFAVPFSIAMSALISGNLSSDWIQMIKKWSTFSWFFLGVGILLGSKWAYEELGWGGYWAWDPVENASLMPWLLSTAFIHSIIIQERRGMLKFWNMLLIILTFHFTLLGTWITRSGVLEGPHSFSKSTIGTPFILYIFLSFFVYLGILIYRRNDLKPERSLETVSMTSKEGSFFLNNYLLVLACLVILLGVFSPLLYGKEFKAPWFNSWGVPAGLFLLFLMGVSPLLAWRKSAKTVFFTSLLKPTLAGIVSSVLYGLLYSSYFHKSEYSSGNYLSEVYSTLTIGLGTFTIAGIFQEYHRGIRARQTQFLSENYLAAAVRMSLGNKRRYVGYLVHFALVILFIGLAGNAFKENTSIKFFYDLTNPEPDEIVYVSQDKGVIGNYEIAATSIRLKPLINGDPKAKPTIYNVIVSQEAQFTVRKSLGQNTGSMTTERRFYPQVSHLSGGFETHIPTSEPSILSSLLEDLYIQIGAVEAPSLTGENPELQMLFMDYFFSAGTTEDKVKTFQQFPKQIIGNLEVWINPLVKFIWAGSFLFFLSGLLLVVPIGEKK